MNAAARLVHQSVLTRQFVFVSFWTRQQIAVLMLASAVLLSALGTIYATHITRIMHASYQQALLEQDRLHITHGQLLLERSTWMMQGRIQQLAENQLGMVVPDHKSIVIIHS
jgi:cell division protein FtsL